MSRTKYRRRPSLQRAAVESLEIRRLLTTMTVNGTAAADVIDLNVNGGLVSVVVNGGSPNTTLDLNTTDVVINGLAGADVININSTGSNAVTVNGGTENDAVHLATSSQLLDNIADLVTVNGDAGSDSTVFHDESDTGVTAYHFTAGNKLARTGMSQVTFNTENISLATGSGNDTYNVNGALAAALTVDGNGGSNFLVLLSTTNESAIVSPSGSSSNSGTATFGAQNVTYTDMLRVITGGLGSLRIVTPNAADVLTTADLSTTATLLSGSSGGSTITQVTFSDATSVTLDLGANDAGAGSDSLSLNGSTQGTQLLRVINGTGTNTMLVHSGSYDLDVDLGATLGNTTDITIDGGSVTFHDQQNVRTLALKNGASVSFTGTGDVLRAQDVSITAGSATLNVASNQAGFALNSFSIAANGTCFKAGAGSFAVFGTQTHGAGATFSVTGGSCNFNSDAGSVASRTLNIIVDGTFMSCFASQHVNSVFVFNGGTLSIQPNGNRVLVTNEVLTDFDLPGGKIDLNNNDMIVDYTTVAQANIVRTLLRSGRNNGTWNGLGIMSGAAKNNPLLNTTLGSMEATEFKSIYGPGATFAGQAIDNTAVLIKYTYYGDADFNGEVNFDDYARIDAGRLNSRTGWLNGDFDDNGVVNFDDYALIDGAFNTQGAALSGNLVAPKGAGRGAIRA